MLYAYRASIAHFLSDPGTHGSTGTQYFEDGLLIVERGKVLALGMAHELLPTLPQASCVIDYSGSLILPGFVDTHVHYAQTDMIGSAADNVLDWLEHHTFPAERRFSDAYHARAVAEFFLDELLRNGTTTACVFATVHPQSVDAFFEAAEQRALRMVAGKVLMDRHCPDFLRDTAQSGYHESAALIERWHAVARLHYAITPRFAVTSSAQQLALAGQLAREHPDVRIQSHVAENPQEVKWARELYPECRSYLDIYDHHGLLREHSIYAHCIYLDELDWRLMAARGASAAFCPTSNLFLGSGLFDLTAGERAGAMVSIATDVGGGTSFSMLRTLGEAYKVQQLCGHRLSACRAFYLATLGGARALGLDRYIGNFQVGKEADFVVLDPSSTPLTSRRRAAAHTLEDLLFLLMTLGDDRHVRQTYVLGRAARPAA